ncbi:type I secretion system permease/ATPase [Ruegeria sp. HKCCA6707]|uniref:type I secretion system permease/ATPase n=1 Tax=unclassified Ruegeria TaxID=2625375 RepID=UPI0014897BE1
MKLDASETEPIIKRPSSAEKNFYRLAIDKLRAKILQVGGLSAIVNFLILTGPLYMIVVYDQVLPSGSLDLLGKLFSLVIILFVLFGVFEWWRTRILSRASYQLDAETRDTVCEKWLVEAIEQPGSQHDPLRDLEIMRNFISSPVVLALFDLPWIPLFLGVVFWIHPWLGFLTISGAAIVIVAALLNRKLTQVPVSQATRADNHERSFIRHAHRDAETIFGLGIKDNVIAHWERLHQQSMSHFFKGSDTSDYFAAFSKGFRLFLQSALLTTGAVLAIQHQISLGAIIAVSVLAGRVLAPLDHVITQWRIFGRVLSAHRRLSALQAVPAEPVTVDPSANLITQLRVDAISKSAPTGAQMTRPYILSQVTLSLQPGDGLVVIGNSGAGKSSLAKLLVGIWTPDTGQVLLGGVRVVTQRNSSSRPSVGYLPQRVDLLPGTIAQNISGFEEQTDEQDIVQTAQIAGIHDMVQNMPDGYRTRIGLGGYPLSGGQVQQLGLARAIFKQPRLIVLDEPNSNLDKSGNAALVKAIQDLRNRGSIVVTMAHRPSIVEAGNKVMILHEGRVLKQGDREEVFTTPPVEKQKMKIAPLPPRQRRVTSAGKRRQS